MAGLLLMLIIGIILIVWIVSLYNQLRRSKQLTALAWEGVVEQLRRRWKLIPSVLSIAKQKDENLVPLADAVDAAYVSACQANVVSEHADKEQLLSEALQALFVAAQKSPELMKNRQFGDLTACMTEIDKEIRLAQRFYNGAVKQYNHALYEFPSMVVARIWRFSAAPYFEL